MSLIKTKFNRYKSRRIKLSYRNKIEYLNNQLKKTKAEKISKEEDLMSEKNKVNDLKKLIECPVCLDVPRKGPVFSCPNGHLVCSKCKRESCPTCREVMGENKSLVATAVIEKVLHECKFVECEAEFPLQRIEQHEKYCYHRLVPCLDYGHCNQKVALSKLLDHLIKKPCSANRPPWALNKSKGIGLYGVPSREMFESPRLHFKVYTYVYMGSLLALYVNKSGDNWHFTVVMCFPPEVCSEFNIEMEVYETGSDPDTRLSAKIRCHPCSIDQPVAEMNGLCLSVHHRFMEMMLKKDSMRFTVSFSFL